MSQWQVLHITSDLCAVCDIVGIKLEEQLRGFPPGQVAYVPLSTTAQPHLVAQYNIIHYPTVILYYEGKAYQRYEQVFSIDQVIDDLNRYLALMAD